ncbi:MAG: hypothetical protein PHE53_07995 [Thermoguttaceae bacterium]|nr:hypothetical protein [Thermoguttaceae bacterium]
MKSQVASTPFAIFLPNQSLFCRLLWRFTNRCRFSPAIAVTVSESGFHWDGD